MTKDQFDLSNISGLGGATKKKLEDIVVQLVMTELNHPGELNYLFTEIALKYLDCKEESYETYNSIMGALECAQFELYRKKIAFYEDKKCQENGEIYK